MRKVMLEGNPCIFGMEVGTLIYGGGKRIVKSFQDFGLSAEPYMKAEGNQMYYFGDLDYEGIGIYESPARQWRGHGKLIPFAAAHGKMIEKAERMGSLPDTKERQNQKLSGEFFSCFSKEMAGRMQEILERGEYIPQEILSSWK